MTAWRWRRCPVCGTVSSAGDFRLVQFRIGWQPQGDTRGECPNCGYRGETSRFLVVREKHPTSAAR
jgi:DNA-directed RNA polymerase subunit RPC12/RpoP